MNAATRTNVPQPRDGRAELAALALAIAGQVDDRQNRGDETAPVSGESPVAMSRRHRRVRWVVAGTAVLAIAAATSVALLPHHRGARHLALPHPAAHVAATPATRLGAAAHARLGRGDAPVTDFGCEAAYAGDAEATPTVLPSGGTTTTAYREYMRACLSGMS